MKTRGFRFLNPGFRNLRVMNFEIWRVKNVVDLWWQIFRQFSTGKIGSTFVTEKFTTIFTARKDKIDLELTLGASSPKFYAKFTLNYATSTLNHTNFTITLR